MTAHDHTLIELALALCPPHHREGWTAMVTDGQGRTRSQSSERRPCTLHSAEAAGLLASSAFARIVADAEQRGREDNPTHEMCYVSGSPALEARLASAWREGYLRGTLDNESDLEPADNPYREVEDELCHCGAPVSESPEVPMGETLGPAARALCEDCLPVRCDAYPGACKR